ncbi:MAG: hypothetical protein OQK74_09960, partial [Gammaproteobacteria bacterium]|nr:hypothetical protein [Gammaproteobacteria bacterium]
MSKSIVQPKQGFPGQIGISGTHIAVTAHIPSVRKRDLALARTNPAHEGHVEVFDDVNETDVDADPTYRLDVRVFGVIALFDYGGY